MLNTAFGGQIHVYTTKKINKQQNVFFLSKGQCNIHAPLQVYNIDKSICTISPTIKNDQPLMRTFKCI